MQGLMMDLPLTITSIIRHAEAVHGHKETIVSDNILAAWNTEQGMAPTKAFTA